MKLSPKNYINNFRYININNCRLKTS